MSNYDRRITVADILRREGVTEELPVVVEADDTPTERIPVVELLQREGRWDRRRTAKMGAVAAGVAALAGLAISVLGAGHADNETLAPLAGGAGGGAVDPATSTSSSPVTTDSQLLASTSPTFVGGTLGGAGSASTAGALPSPQTRTTHRDAQPAPVKTTTESSPASSSSHDAVTSSAGSSSSTSRTTTTTPSPDQTSPNDDGRGTHGHPGSDGPVGDLTDALGGVLGGLFG